MLIDESIKSVSLGREYKRSIVPACKFAFSEARSFLAFRYLLSGTLHIYNITALFLSNLYNIAVVLYGIRYKGERKEEEVATRSEQAKRKLDPSSSRILPSMTKGESMTWKTH